MAIVNKKKKIKGSWWYLKSEYILLSCQLYMLDLVFLPFLQTGCIQCQSHIFKALISEWKSVCICLCCESVCICLCLCFKQNQCCCCFVFVYSHRNMLQQQDCFTHPFASLLPGASLQLPPFGKDIYYRETQTLHQVVTTTLKYFY